MKKLMMVSAALAGMLAIGLVSAAAQQDDEPRQIPLVCDALTSGTTADRVSYYVGEGVAYYYAGLYDRAEDSMSCIVEQIDSDSLIGFTSRGQIYMAQRNYVEAIEDFGSAIALDAQNFGAHNNRGIAYASRGQTEEAMADFDRAISLAPEYRPARINRAVLHAALNDYEAAIADLEQVISEGGLDAVLIELAREDRQSDDPIPPYDPVDAQAYAILGIVYSDFALANYRNYARLTDDTDFRIQSAAGALESRANFDLRLDDGSYYTAVDFIAAIFD